MAEFDFLIIGSGIAGASAAARLAGRARVALFEREGAHGYHTTGRSAALWSALYGAGPIRTLTVASRGFYDAPPEGFTDYPLLRPRGCLYFGGPDQVSDLEGIAAGASALNITTRFVEAAECLTFCPVMRPERLAAGLHEPDAMDIDVNALHQGFLRMCRALGGDVRTDAEVAALDRSAGAWTVRLANGETHRAGVVIDAAGAWADQVAALAGAQSVGLSPLKRTAFLLDEPDAVSARDWPAMIEANEAFYFKPESGKILVSPCDETPSAPCDAWPEDLDIAECVERLQDAADIPVRRIVRSWAGLRSFVVAAALALGESLPGDVADLGLREAQLSPARFRA
jgi:D-arginine dehydrogenase